MPDVVIIGGGAAGFFAAANLGKLRPDLRILMLEKTGKLLSKVKISGGGRCNVTHNCLDNKPLLENYPRGADWLAPVFNQFSVKNAINWFLEEGIALHTEPDGRMFPVSNQSQTIVHCLENAAIRNPMFQLKLHSGVVSIERTDNHKFSLHTGNETFIAQKILVTTGGFPSASGFGFLEKQGIAVVEPIPSLFTFNVKPHPWAELQGVSLTDTRVSLAGTDFQFRGPLLVTHWGFSGPAVLKLSAFAARYLAEKQYQYTFSVDFLPNQTQAETIDYMLAFQKNNPKKVPCGSPMFGLPKSIWIKLCQSAGLQGYMNWAETGKKTILKMAGLLHAHPFEGNGKTTYKDEFVTAGGVDLQYVDANTCQSKTCHGLYFAGEVLNVDGITGGFNFQAAWSTAFVAATSIAADC